MDNLKSGEAIRLPLRKSLPMTPAAQLDFLHEYCKLLVRDAKIKMLTDKESAFKKYAESNHEKQWTIETETLSALGKIIDDFCGDIEENKETHE